LLWLTDITEHPTAEGRLNLCAITGACTNRIVGYSMDARMTSRPAVDALRHAVALRRPVGTVVHPDRGSQFRSGIRHMPGLSLVEDAARSRSPSPTFVEHPSAPGLAAVQLVLSPHRRGPT
jgi:hypothetical protein